MKKKLTADQKIIAAFDSIDKCVRMLRQHAERYNAHIDKALLQNNEKKVKELIRTKLNLQDLAGMLEDLKANLELGACNAKVASSLGTLPAALSGCKGLLAEAPNFKKLGADIRKIFADMQRPADEISKLNGILGDALAPAGASDLETVLGLSAESDLVNSDRYRAELANAIGRTNGPAVPAAEPADAVETGEFDISKLMSEENKRK